MPARTRFRTAVRRKSCGTRPGQPARRQAVRKATRNDRTGLPARWNRCDTTRFCLRCTASAAALCCEQTPELGRHWEGSSLAVLCGPRIEPNFAGTEVHVFPLERKHLAVDAPSRDVGKRDNWPYFPRHVANDSFEVVVVEEPGSYVVLPQHRSVGLLDQFSGLKCEVEHTLERCELPVDLGIGHTRDGPSLRRHLPNRPVTSCELQTASPRRSANPDGRAVSTN